MFHPELGSSIAKVLILMADPPNVRSKPIDGDLEGDFHMWFDGGAVRQDTGVSTYHFADGTRATTGTSLLFSVGIAFTDGREISIAENPAVGVGV